MDVYKQELTHLAFLQQTSLPAMSEFTACLWLDSADRGVAGFEWIFSISTYRKYSISNCIVATDTKDTQ